MGKLEAPIGCKRAHERRYGRRGRDHRLMRWCAQRWAEQFSMQRVGALDRWTNGGEVTFRVFHAASTLQG